MHSQFFTTILLALCVAHGVLSIPLELAPEAPAADDAERENETRINAANVLANKNILKMEHVLNHPTDAGHQEMIDAAFGKDASLNMDKIKETVQNLKDGPAVPIQLASDPTPGVIAYTKFAGTKTPLTPTGVVFGDKYHAADTSDDARAATLIHEATHFQSDTGDNVVKGKVLPGSDKRGSREKMYTSQMEPYKTADELNTDQKWTKLRDEGKTYWDETIPATKDMHNAAEAFGQFSSMCGAAVSDAAVGLRRRTMAAGNWDEAAAYLIRRQYCTLPRKPAAKVPAETKSKASGAASANRSLPPTAKSKSKAALARKSKAKAASRVASAKFGKKAVVGKSTLSRSKKDGAVAAGRLGGKRVGAASRKAPLGAAKSLAKGVKTGTRAKASKSKSGALSRGRVPNSKSVKGSKVLAGSRGKVSLKTLSKVGGSKSKPITKGRTVKGLAKGGQAKKALGSAKRPLSKTAASKRPVAKKNVLNGKAKSSTKKTVARPGAKKSVPRPGAKSAAKKTIARPGAKKTVARPTSKKGTNAARPVSKKTVARPPSKKNVGRPVASKKNVGRPAPKKNVARPVIKKSANPVSKSPAQRQTRPQVASSKVVPKVAPAAKIAPKKVRRDLEFQL